MSRDSACIVLYPVFCSRPTMKVIAYIVVNCSSIHVGQMTQSWLTVGVDHAMIRIISIQSFVWVLSGSRSLSREQQDK